MRLSVVAFIVIWFTASACSVVLAQTILLSPEQRFSNKAIIQCVNAETKGMRSRISALEKQANDFRKSNSSIAPIVLQKRRLEEEWCTIEASCASRASQEHKDLVYGEIFAACLRAAS